jgi:hypothetical protein
LISHSAKPFAAIGPNAMVTHDVSRSTSSPISGSTSAAMIIVQSLLADEFGLPYPPK